MSLTNEQIQEIVTQFGKDKNDTGSSQVQVALLTARIRSLTDHVKINTKDNIINANPKKTIKLLINFEVFGEF